MLCNKHCILGRGEWDEGRGTRGEGRGEWDEGSGTRGVGRGEWDEGSGTRGVGRGEWDEGSGTRGVGRGEWDEGSGTRGVGRGEWDEGSGTIRPTLQGISKMPYIHYTGLVKVSHIFRCHQEFYLLLVDGMSLLLWLCCNLFWIVGCWVDCRPQIQGYIQAHVWLFFCPG